MKTKTKHQHPAVSLSNPLHTVLFAVTMLVLLASDIAHADYIYVSCYNQSSGTIEKFDSGGNRSIFASGLNSPFFIAVQPVPEPATLLLLGLGAVMLKRRR